METIDHARLAYDAFAPIYDDFNAQNRYDLWFEALIPKLEGLGLPEEGRLLDVACGTGQAFDPIGECGWAKEIVGCDISPAMIAEAREKFDGIELDVADMRSLPVYRPDGFELVWALNDAVNFLLGEGDLQRALAAMGANLAKDGLLVFDCNTLRLFREMYDPSEGLDRDARWHWRGRGLVDGIYEAEISGEQIETLVHKERHHSVAKVRQAVLDAGLRPLAALGQREDDGTLVIDDDWDEERDHKIVHVARRG